MYPCTIRFSLKSTRVAPKRIKMMNHFVNETPFETRPIVSRRSFLKGLSRTATAALLMQPVNALAKISTERHLAFYNTHTSEKLDIVYFSRGRYLPDALAEMNHLFRDHRTDEVHAMDSRLFDILHDLTSLANHTGTFEIISGYRSPATNAMLRKRSKRVAKKSYHMRGQAMDIRLPGTDTKRLRNMAIALQQGGVGYYRKSDFIHIDTGRVRSW